MMAEQPSFTGRVWSMAAIDFPSADPTPRFTFNVYKEAATPAFKVYYFDLNKRGAQAVVAIVAAAYTAQTEIDVFEEKPGDDAMWVKWVQASKPPNPGKA